jgi:hypothetical protein
MSILSSALEVAHRAAARVAGGRVVAQWQGESLTIEHCVFGRALQVCEDDAGGGAARLEYGQPDLVIEAASLVFGGRIVEPQDGMRFTAVAEGGTYGETYEATPNPGGRCFDNCDPRGVLIRVHAKKVAA